MKQRSTLLFLSSWLATAAVAQTTITGSVRYGASKPLPFASIALLNAKDSTSHTFKLPKGFTGEITAFYQTSSLSGISRIRAFGSVNAGLQKKLPGDGGSLLVNIADIFWTNRYRFITDNPTVGQVGNWALLSEPRVMRFTYTRNFGSQTVKAASKRATGSEEERSRVQTNKV